MDGILARTYRSQPTTKGAHMTMELARDDLDVGFVAHDAPAMLRFYGDVLGLSRGATIRVPGIGLLHRFTVGTSLLKIVEPDRTPTSPPEAGMPWESAGVRYVTFHVTDVRALVAALVGDGVEAATEVLEPAPGVRYAIVKDPDGNGVELVEGG
jgi:catechol 2,3-dioxygenase-like lactoylglutathione lyase family enzyme